MTAQTHSGPEWLARHERGLMPCIRFAVWAAIKFGRQTARLMLYPISAYYLMFSGQARAASRSYLARVLDRAPTVADVFRHFYSFAACVLDRVYFLKDRTDDFDLHVYGEEIVDEILQRGGGAILLGAHLGSFEAMRALGRKRPHLHVSLAMYEHNARKTNAVLNAINPGLAIDIIGLGNYDAMLDLQNRLEKGHLVGILADRSLQDEGRLPQQFLGASAGFPVGPFRIAAILKRPIILMFGLYRGGRRYDIHFEYLADFADRPHSERTEAIAVAMRGYAARLEHYCRAAPLNWFNFYDFWA